ncbi:eclosion hormone [Andrena cerasifolii]|uniref:eclosion hormone n=1 Tax=Andrena cerasifolii TaxID=2819439 RepID=UPI004037907B
MNLASTDIYKAVIVQLLSVIRLVLSIPAALARFQPQKRPVMNSSTRVLLVILVASVTILVLAAGGSVFDRAIGVCIRNCAQCKKMFGPYFLGQKCADSCVKYKGKLIPDCEDEVSIQPFLQALDSDY